MVQVAESLGKGHSRHLKLSNLAKKLSHIYFTHLTRRADNRYWLELDLGHAISDVRTKDNVMGLEQIKQLI